MGKRIESKISKTALGTCLMRAASYYEKDPYYKSEDFIAAMIIPSYLKAMVKYNISRTALKKVLFKVPGIYEYIVSRTKFIDEIFSSLDAKTEQVLILGAGFDSRTIRFKDKFTKAKMFELDAPVTQQVKVNRFTKKNIPFPPNLTFISIDFNTELLAEKLNEAGFQKNCRCLFLLEGLTYYLNPEAIESTLTLLSNYSAKDSLLVFDYAAASFVSQEKMQADPKLKEHYQSLVKAGERPGFAIAEQIQDFLAKYKFELVEEVNSIHLAKKYFNNDDFPATAQQFRIVKAIKKV